MTDGLCEHCYRALADGRSWCPVCGEVLNRRAAHSQQPPAWSFSEAVDYLPPGRR